ncbi:ATP-binding cassette domain-containing protein [Candidatus Woesearchaeota archaeon]|nr:ATP-binding cassette domain-containing protein [Candidatus Woesearchaeota archaeon]
MIKATDLSKAYRIPHEKRTTLFENILHLLRGSFEYERLDALKNINLEVKPGECLGIIGPNGSGKSTLLKMLAGIVKPTEGLIKTEGDVVPFLDLSVGFQGDLTAKENIYLYGSLRGLTRKEIHKRFDDIIEFAGLKKFVDTKLKDFSSGMHARLAFSTAIQTEGDIFLIDEVLAVGDMEFQKKCFGVFEKLKKEGKCIVLVSHNLELVRLFCDRALYLDGGRFSFCGPSDEAIQLYQGKEEVNNIDPLIIQKAMGAEKEGKEKQNKNSKVMKVVNVKDIMFKDIGGNQTKSIAVGNRYEMHARVKLNRMPPKIIVLCASIKGQIWQEITQGRILSIDKKKKEFCAAYDQLFRSEGDYGFCIGVLDTRYGYNLDAVVVKEAEARINVKSKEKR